MKTNRDNAFCTELLTPNHISLYTYFIFWSSTYHGYHNATPNTQSSINKPTAASQHCASSPLTSFSPVAMALQATFEADSMRECGCIMRRRIKGQTNITVPQASHHHTPSSPIVRWVLYLISTVHTVRQLICVSEDVHWDEGRYSVTQRASHKYTANTSDFRPQELWHILYLISKSYLLQGFFCCQWTQTNILILNIFIQ